MGRSRAAGTGREGPLPLPLPLPAHSTRLGTMTGNELSRPDKRLSRLERRTWIAIFIGLAVAISVVERHERACQ